MRGTSLTTREVFDHWNKNFKDNGIFEEWARAYGVEVKALTRGRLKELTEEDGGRIFNQFAEILRHNVVSDKPNAFNKIFNLFLCKIVDENRKPSEELKFQWHENDTDEELQKRLSDLYREGMKKYLMKEVTDYNDEQINEKLFALDVEAQKQIRDMFTRVRLYKNNEFAFKEVFDEKSFCENAVVVREVVELLQPYQIRYGHKQQFLGDFFELLLSTGIKQEAGQFFTPVPIARFIVSSLPLRELIAKKITDGETTFLPYIIDYAAGSGHFLTEAMDEVQSIVDQFDADEQKPDVKSKLRGWRESKFGWASEYVYGIEADYRLVKTAKVSCFLNGDGEANVIHADGLDSFRSSIDFKGKLKELSPSDPRDNGQFDVLVANPPYSVAAFKNTLKRGSESFELYDRLTDDSAEIECLFIERTKQLLRVGGWAGIILPSSILNNSGIYIGAREIILKYFRVKAVAEFGSSTFMATGTNTVTLFLERRPNNDWKRIEQAIRSFFEYPKEATVNGIEKAFGTYVAEVFSGIEFADYRSLVNRTPSEAMRQNELFVDYQAWFNNLTEVKTLKVKKVFVEKPEIEQQAELDGLLYDKVFARERERMLYFFLAKPQQTVVIKVGDKQAEKNFIGYEFSNRRGNEGIKMYRDAAGSLMTKLYDDADHLNPLKANSYIYKALLGETAAVDASLASNIVTYNTADLLDFKKPNFEKALALEVKKKVSVTSKWRLERVKNVASMITKGTTPTSIGYSFQRNGVNFVKIESIKHGVLLKEKFAHISEECHSRMSRSQLQEHDVLVSIAGSFGRVAVVSDDILPANTNQAVAIVRVRQDVVAAKYLHLVLQSASASKQVAQLIKGVAQYNLSLEQVGNLLVPLPSMDVQQKIVAEVAAIEQKRAAGVDRMTDLDAEMETLYRGDKLANAAKRLSNHVDIIGGGTPDSRKPSYWNGNIPWLSVADFNDDRRFVSTSQKRITSEGLNNSSTKLLDVGDLIISARGTVGAIAQLAVPMTFNQSCYGLRGKNGLTNDYLYYALKYEIDQLKANSSGVIFNAITTKTFDSIYIPIPHTGQQLALAAEFEKLETERADVETALASVEEEKRHVLEKYLE